MFGEHGLRVTVGQHDVSMTFGELGVTLTIGKHRISAFFWQTQGKSQILLLNTE